MVGVEVARGILMQVHQAALAVVATVQADRGVYLFQPALPELQIGVAVVVVGITV